MHEVSKKFNSIEQQKKASRKRNMENEMLNLKRRKQNVESEMSKAKCRKQNIESKIWRKNVESIQKWKK